MEHLYFRTTSFGECSLWQGAVSDTGYAARRLYGKTEYVHRLTWRRERGAVPRLLRNTCGHKHCINPYHWEPVQYLRTYDTDTKKWTREPLLASPSPPV